MTNSQIAQIKKGDVLQTENGFGWEATHDAVVSSIDAIDAWVTIAYGKSAVRLTCKHSQRFAHWKRSEIELTATVAPAH